MIPETALILLDTNILVYLLRGKTVGKQIEADHKLYQRRLKPLISFITVGEMLALTLKFNWGNQRKEKLKNLLHELTIVNIHEQNIVQTYANINHFSEKTIKPARPMGQNDMWIAATARCLDAWLITMDKDFDHLHQNKYIKRVKIDLKTGLTLSE
jgi:tRNA(fMet)-specific endonuclease VapC